MMSRLRRSPYTGEGDEQSVYTDRESSVFVQEWQISQ